MESLFCALYNLKNMSTPAREETKKPHLNIFNQRFVQKFHSDLVIFCYLESKKKAINGENQMGFRVTDVSMLRRSLTAFRRML